MDRLTGFRIAVPYTRRRSILCFSFTAGITISCFFSGPMYIYTNRRTKSVKLFRERTAEDSALPTDQKLLMLVGAIRVVNIRHQTCEKKGNPSCKNPTSEL